MKCLLHHYGSYDLLPSRKKKTSHCFLGFSPPREFKNLCEIDLSDIVPAEALSPFMDELKKREKQRKQLAKKEHQDKIKAEAVAAFSLPVPYNMVQSSYNTPTFSMDDFEGHGPTQSFH
ncbi:RING finger protein 10 [Bienertia sinuspersici]